MEKRASLINCRSVSQNTSHNFSLFVGEMLVSKKRSPKSTQFQIKSSKTGKSFLKNEFEFILSHFFQAASWYFFVNTSSCLKVWRPSKKNKSWEISETGCWAIFLLIFPMQLNKKGNTFKLNVFSPLIFLGIAELIFFLCTINKHFIKI